MPRPATIFALLALLLPLCSACSCVPPSLCRTYDSPGVLSFVKAKVLRVKVPSKPTKLIKYKLRLLQNFKGCPPSNKFTVFSRRSSASCGGILLEKKKVYILPVRGGKKPMIFLCDYIRLYSSLTKADIQFLSTRNACCRGVCKCASGIPPVNCFAAPCTVSTKPRGCALGKCTDNYCGGCLAEWFDKNGGRCKSRKPVLTS